MLHNDSFKKGKKVYTMTHLLRLIQLKKWVYIADRAYPPHFLANMSLKRLIKHARGGTLREAVVIKRWGKRYTFKEVW